MKLSTFCALALLSSATATAQSPNIRAVIRPEFHRGSPVRVSASYKGVPAAVRAATIGALQDAGYTVLTNHPRRKQEYVLVLRANCRQDPAKTWVCTEYAARLVDRDGADVRASAVLNPLARPATSLREIRESVAVGWFTDGP